MSKYTKLSIWYLLCICAGLAAGWLQGGSLDAVLWAATVSACVVAGMFLVMAAYDWIKRERHSVRGGETRPGAGAANRGGERRRPCPACRQGRVVVAELRDGAACSHCRGIVEVDPFYSLIPGLLLISGSIVCHRMEWPLVAAILAYTGFLYGAGIHQITGRWFPLKCCER